METEQLWKIPVFGFVNNLEMLKLRIIIFYHNVGASHILVLDDIGNHWNHYVAMETTPKISKISKCSKFFETS